METTITWKEAATFIAESGSGHRVTIDGPPEMGGRNKGARPMELMLTGLAGCAAFDVVHILKKGRAAITRCEANVTAERAESDPKVFTAIHLHFTVAGNNLTEKKVARAIELSAEKYCSASILMRRAGVQVTHSFELSPLMTSQPSSRSPSLLC